MESLSSSQYAGVHVLRHIRSSEANGKEEEGRHRHGISPSPVAAPALGTQSSQLPTQARARSSLAAPRHRESPAEHTTCAKVGLALGEDGTFPEQMKSSKTLSCQFEETYAFCKFLES